MKKTFVILISLFCAFLITEELEINLLKFPKYGVEHKIRGITTLKNRGEIYKPYSGYINNENGYKVFARNNAGLSGTDIVASDSSKYILVLGNSFIEGYQIDPNYISTSIFQQKCRSINMKYQVVNLGSSGHDAYDLWFRANYFDHLYPPSSIILVITEFGLLNHSGTLNFTLPVDFGTVNDSPGLIISTWLRNSSSFINLVATALKYASVQKDASVMEDLALRENRVNKNLNDSTSMLTSGLGQCLLEFNNRYKDKFIVVSILEDTIQNKSILEFCGRNHMYFNSSPLLTPQFEIKGEGHLSEEGNKKLGELLYESFIKRIY